MTSATTNLTGYLYAALTLSERCSTLRQAAARLSDKQVDRVHAARALRRWKSQQPFTVSEHFESRLKTDGLTEEALLSILALRSEQCAEFFETHPQWVLDLDRLYAAEHSPVVYPQFLEWVKNGTNGLLWIAEPLIKEGLRRLREALLAISATDSFVKPVVIERLALPNLFSALKPAVEKAMVLELNIARVQGELQGERADERFRSFCDRLRDSEVRSSMVREYPVLFRSLYVRTINWVECTVELIERLFDDWDLVKRELLPETELTSLTAISAGAGGDEHRQGRTVAILEFSSGAKLVYKPRSMSLDAHFGEFLGWVNQSGFEPSFRSPRVIARDGYGWSEFIHYQACSNRGEVDRFYQRLGGYLAIFHALRANDMHFENLIAAGEFPIPVDVETLFHCAVKQEEDPAFNAWQSSVMHVLLLPTRILGSETQEGVDISGLGGKSGQYYPAGSVETWEDAGTDEMHLIRDRAIIMSAGDNRPKLKTADVSLDEFAESFVSGFTRAYRLLESRRSELLMPGGILDRFGEDEVRFLARPTMTYSTLLAKAFHPDMLRDGINRDRLLDYLWIGAAGLPHLAQLIPAERQDLASGDIPAFTARPSSRDLWTSSGERIAGFFEETAIETVHQGFRRMSDEDLDLQTWYIRAAIASGADSPQVAHAPLLLANGHGSIDLARAVGDALCEQALQYDSYASWIGLTPLGSGETSWSLEPLDLGLYAGISGCSFFLGYLSDMTGDDRYRTIARKSIALVRRQLERLKRGALPMLGLGGFSGAGGIIYTLAHLGFLWQDESLIDEAHSIASDVPLLIDSDRMLDVMSGCAGCIAALRVLDRISPRDQLLKVAARCGEHLLSHQKQQDIGGAWEGDASSIRPLTGFSHGAAGIAWALLKLAAWSNDRRYRTAAESAIAYERSTFVAAESNWPDFRRRNSAPKEGDSKPRFCAAWCHGAAGIALARIDSLEYQNDRQTYDEINIGLQTTLDLGFGVDRCLCHGDFGNLDIVTLAEQRIGAPWDRIRKRFATDVLARAAAEQSPPAPGLMVGLAGVGYSLLRLSSPDRVPSVLVLEAPVRG